MVGDYTINLQDSMLDQTVETFRPRPGVSYVKYISKILAALFSSRYHLVSWLVCILNVYA